MTGLPHHLDRAAGDPGGDLDLAVLHERARHRRARRRAGLAGAAAVVLLAAGGLAWSAAATDAPQQQLTAGEGGEGTGGGLPVPETTVVVGATGDTVPREPVETPPTTQPPEPVEPPVTTAVPEEPATTTAPGVTVPPEPPAGTITTTLTGTYAGHETYRLSGPCPAGDTSHTLEASFTSDRGTFTYVADYCGHAEGSTWTATGHGTLTDEAGNQIAVGIAHSAPYPTTGVPYSVTIRGGTGPYAEATGSCDLTVAITNPVLGSQDQAGEFTCRIVRPGAPT